MFDPHVRTILVTGQGMADPVLPELKKLSSSAFQFVYQGFVSSTPLV